MLFTIITVVMDEQDELKKTCESIKLQNYKDVEWVVVHGGHHKELLNYLEGQDEFLNMKYISEKDDGIYDAMNKGMAMSSGEYLVFLNAGDVLHDEMVLEKVHAKIVEENSPDIIFGAAELLFLNGQRINRKPKEIAGYISHGLPANHQATYYKKSSIVLPAYDLKYQMCGDYYIVANMYQNQARTTSLNVVLVDFKIGGASYYHPWTLIKEAYLIQRDVLKVSGPKRIKSALRRFVATVAVVLIQNGFMLKVNDAKK